MICRGARPPLLHPLAFYSFLEEGRDWLGIGCQTLEPGPWSARRGAWPPPWASRPIRFSEVSGDSVCGPIWMGARDHRGGCYGLSCGGRGRPPHPLAFYLFSKKGGMLDEDGVRADGRGSRGTWRQGEVVNVVQLWGIGIS